MNEQQTPQQAGSERVTHDRCPCRELWDRVQHCFTVSPAAREHFTNSRVEFLKAIRALIDQRIDTLSGKGAQGTKLTVE